jgi:hypothetical protein
LVVVVAAVLYAFDVVRVVSLAVVKTFIQVELPLFQLPFDLESAIPKRFLTLFNAYVVFSGFVKLLLRKENLIHILI